MHGLLSGTLASRKLANGESVPRRDLDICGRIGFLRSATSVAQQGLTRKERGPVSPVNPAFRHCFPMVCSLCALRSAMALRRGGVGYWIWARRPQLHFCADSSLFGHARKLKPRIRIFPARSREPHSHPTKIELASRWQGCQRGKRALGQEGVSTSRGSLHPRCRPTRQMYRQSAGLPLLRLSAATARLGAEQTTRSMHLGTLRILVHSGGQQRSFGL